MNRRISKYPGDLPIAEFLNYEPKVGAGHTVSFVVFGNNFNAQLRVTFWDQQTNAMIGGANVRLSPNGVRGQGYGTSDWSIEGEVDIPKPGLYQLVLKNPGTAMRAQPHWIAQDGAGAP